MISHSELAEAAPVRLADVGSVLIGSLFSGYGGLDLGVIEALAVRGAVAEVAWHAEIEPGPCRVLAHHWPDAPNLGDVTAIDWSRVPRIHVLTLGFPCQDVSLAGLRAGLREGTRSGLWAEAARAIDVLRPGLVVIENVRGLLSAKAGDPREVVGEMEPDSWAVGDGVDGPVLRALGAVLGDLADLGYDARWVGLRAADAGAPHGRFRVFIVAHPAGQPWRVDVRSGSAATDADDVGGERDRGARHGSTGSPNGDQAPQDAAVEPGPERRVAASGEAAGGRAWPDAGGRGGAPAPNAGRSGLGTGPVEGGGGLVDAISSGAQSGRRRPRVHANAPDAVGVDDERRGGPGGMAGAAGAGEGDRGERERDGDAVDDRGAAPRDWGPYAAAIARWEAVLGRVAPDPTAADGRAGGHRLAPAFVEWMMGLPAGHVTDPAIGLRRTEELKALGNGVVPQQAALGVGYLLDAEALGA